MSDMMLTALISAAAAIIGGTFYGLAVGVVNVLSDRKLKEAEAEKTAAEAEAKRLENEKTRMSLLQYARELKYDLPENLRPKGKQ